MNVKLLYDVLNDMHIWDLAEITVDGRKIQNLCATYDLDGEVCKIDLRTEEGEE